MLSPSSVQCLQSGVEKPNLIVDDANLPGTAFALRDLLATSPTFFSRGVPVRLFSDPSTGLPTVVPLNRSRVVIEVHTRCRPVVVRKGEQNPVQLPFAVADLYLALQGEWNLRPLAGITSSPLLEADGTIRTSEGYDPQMKLWCAPFPRLTLHERPTDGDAEMALLMLRDTIKTFPFADAVRKRDRSGVEVVDLDQPPGQDESALLNALVTASCRASLEFAPGILVEAPAISGSGTGKGLLVRAISAIAFGISPKPFTAGENRNELDKRIAAALVTAEPILFLDNVNSRVLRSNLLAQVVTERSVIVRRLGATCMVPLSSTAFVAVTGNGIVLAEDLARRFIVSELDAHCEDPEQRELPNGFLVDILRRRSELLTAALTILRWGRQNPTKLDCGRPLGSFEQWASWCRDPLLTLGASDPVKRINTTKARDPGRHNISELFAVWHTHHAEAPVAAADLAEPVCKLIDKQGRGRQFIATYCASLANTRVGGFVLTQQRPAGKWGRTTYAVQRTDNIADAPLGARQPMSKASGSSGSSSRGSSR